LKMALGEYSTVVIKRASNFCTANVFKVYNRSDKIN
jgi:hypothetical protein